MKKGIHTVNLIKQKQVYVTILHVLFLFYRKPEIHNDLPIFLTYGCQKSLIMSIQLISKK